MPDTRAKLEEAAAETGWSLSQVIEHRLRRTFIEDERIADAFGDNRTYLLMRLISLALHTAWNPDNPDAKWLDDPVAFDQAVRTVSAVLGAIRPKGEETASSGSIHDLYLSGRPNATAAQLWKAVQDADPTLPLSQGPRNHHLFGRFQTELGEIVGRPQVFVGTAAQMRARAAEMEAEESDGKGP